MLHFSDVIVLTPKGNFWTVSLLHSASDTIGFLDPVHHLALITEHSVLDTGSLLFSGGRVPRHLCTWVYSQQLISMSALMAQSLNLAIGR